MTNDALLDLLLAPDLWLGVVLAVVYSAIFYGWRGGSFRQLRWDLLAGTLGFAFGQAAGIFLRLNFLRVGDLQLFSATLCALLALWAGRRLAHSAL